MSSEEETPYGLGVRNKTVKLASPDPRWHRAYEEEADRVRHALGDLAVDIQHFGSTSIPAIKAKPIIDILVGVRRFEDGLACIEPMASIGYEYVGTDLVPDDHIFGKGTPGEMRTHLVHVVEYDGFHWRRDLLFRNRLLEDPTIAAEYEALKITLAQQYANDRAGYTAAKKAFIDVVIGETGKS